MQTGALTLSDALWPRVGLWQRDAVRTVTLMVGFAGFVALCAQIAIRLPWTTVPITGQTFAVLVAGGTLGAWRGAGSLTIYMLMGTVGIPVFAPGSGVTTGTWDVHFIAPWSGTAALPWDISSGGYIVGFIFAAALVGYLAEKRQWDRKPWVHLGMFLGNVSLYVPGILWLAYLIGSGWIHPVGKPLAELIAGSGTWDKALKGGLYPFIVGDLMKLLLASLLLPTAWAITGRFPRKKPTS
ncbi:MAG: biotin transporter BioY [Chloroflexi bacterium]|nr:biotin transporter BioY [Chloroflexota bacterium]